MKILKTLDPSTVRPWRFQARCLQCQWASEACCYQEDAEMVGGHHVAMVRHRVEIVEEE